jgi:hypothetical protein
MFLSLNYPPSAQCPSLDPSRRNPTTSYTSNLFFSFTSLSFTQSGFHADCSSCSFAALHFDSFFLFLPVSSPPRHLPHHLLRLLTPALSHPVLSLRHSSPSSSPSSSLALFPPLTLRPTPLDFYLHPFLDISAQGYDTPWPLDILTCSYPLT